MKQNVLENYMQLRAQVYEDLLPKNMESAMLSEANWIGRGTYMSGEDIGIYVNVGDIAYMDFGQAYLNEMGYQHFALIVALCEKKALVIPMTSNHQTCTNAYNYKENPNGKKNLFALPEIDGLFKRSVLFLNDMKFINTARIIDVKAHLDVKSAVFRKIQLQIMALLFASKNDVL